MRATPLSFQRGLLALVLVPLACADPPAAPGGPSDVRGARGTTTTTGPRVTSTNPSTAPREATLDVRVLGSGFDQGSTAQWAIDGVPSGKVLVNSTRYVSSKELVANITIAADADTTLYDVIVTTAAGKPGIGTETFEVTEAPLATILPGLSRGNSEAYGVNDAGVIVGSSNDGRASRPVRWERGADGQWQVIALPVIASAYPIVINNAGTIAGRWHDGVTWRLVAWVRQPNGSYGGSEIGPGYAMDMNAAGWIAGRTNGVPVVWRAVSPSGPWLAPEALPLGPGTRGEVNGIGGGVVPTVAGKLVIEGREIATIWKFQNGAWSAPIVLDDQEYDGRLASDVNAAGDVVLHAWRQGPCVPGGDARVMCGTSLLTSAVGTTVVLNQPSGSECSLLGNSMRPDITDGGLVAMTRGSCYGSGAYGIWTIAGAVPRVLRPARGYLAAETNAISDANLVVGFSRNSSATRASVWVLPM